MDGTRMGLGIIGLLLAAGGGWLWLAGDTVNGGIAVRVGLVSLAVWMAWPVLTTRSLTRFAVLGGSLLIVIARPRAAWVVVPVILVWAALKPRPAE
jgi:hypothetical protein